MRKGGIFAEADGRAGLSRSLLLGFYVNHLASVIGTAHGAGVMVQFGTVALGAFHQRRRFDSGMAQPVGGT